MTSVIESHSCDKSSSANSSLLNFTCLDLAGTTKIVYNSWSAFFFFPSLHRQDAWLIHHIDTTTPWYLSIECDDLIYIKEETAEFFEALIVLVKIKQTPSSRTFQAIFRTQVWFRSQVIGGGDQTPGDSFITLKVSLLSFPRLHGYPDSVKLIWVESCGKAVSEIFWNFDLDVNFTKSHLGKNLSKAQHWDSHIMCEFSCQRAWESTHVWTLRSKDFSAHVKVNSVKVPSAERWAASSSINDLFHLKSLTYGMPHSEFPPGPSLRTTSISCSCLHEQIYKCFTIDVRLPSIKR